jgi:DNA primase
VTDAGHFPPAFLDDIRARVPVSSVVGRKVKLERRGREYVGLSPFSHEKTPSFTVNDEKGFYHCFSTQEHGDIFRFVHEDAGPDVPRGGRGSRAQDAGLEVPQRTAADAQKAARSRRCSNWSTRPARCTRRRCGAPGARTRSRICAAAG